MGQIGITAMLLGISVSLSFSVFHLFFAIHRVFHILLFGLQSIYFYTVASEYYIIQVALASEISRSFVQLLRT